MKSKSHKLQFRFLIQLPRGSKIKQIPLSNLNYLLVYSETRCIVGYKYNFLIFSLNNCRPIKKFVFEGNISNIFYQETRRRIYFTHNSEVLYSISIGSSCKIEPVVLAQKIVSVTIDSCSQTLYCILEERNHNYIRAIGLESNTVVDYNNVNAERLLFMRASKQVVALKDDILTLKPFSLRESTEIRHSIDQKFVSHTALNGACIAYTQQDKDSGRILVSYWKLSNGRSSSQSVKKFEEWQTTEFQYLTSWQGFDWFMHWDSQKEVFNLQEVNPIDGKVISEKVLTLSLDAYQRSQLCFQVINLKRKRRPVFSLVAINKFYETYIEIFQ